MTSHGLEIGQAINNRRRAAITITIITVRTLAGDEYPVEVDGVQIAAWRWGGASSVSRQGDKKRSRTDLA